MNEITCIFHPDRTAIANCVSCRNSICSECRKEIEGKSYCYSCAAQIVLPLKATEAKKGLSCWLKGCAIGCGALILIFLIILSFIWANWERIKEGANKIMDMGQIEIIKEVRNAILVDLPEGFDEQEVRKTFDDLIEMIRNNQTSFLDFAGLINEYKEAMRDNRLDEYELRGILNEAKRIREGVIKKE